MISGYPVTESKLGPLCPSSTITGSPSREYKVMVSGHTDDTPIFTTEFPSNWELSAARAITVVKLLIKNGVDPLRISIQGFAEYRPLYENSTPESKEANRRVEIALIKEENKKEDSDFKY